MNALKYLLYFFKAKNYFLFLSFGLGVKYDLYWDYWVTSTNLCLYDACECCLVCEKWHPYARLAQCVPIDWLVWSDKGRKRARMKAQVISLTQCYKWRPAIMFNWPAGNHENYIKLTPPWSLQSTPLPAHTNQCCPSIHVLY